MIMTTMMMQLHFEAKSPQLSCINFSTYGMLEQILKNYIPFQAQFIKNICKINYNSLIAIQLFSKFIFKPQIYLELFTEFSSLLKLYSVLPDNNILEIV